MIVCSIYYVWLEVASDDSSQTFQTLGGCQDGKPFHFPLVWSSLGVSLTPWDCGSHRSSATPPLPRLASWSHARS